LCVKKYTHMAVDTSTSAKNTRKKCCCHAVVHVVAPVLLLLLLLLHATVRFAAAATHPNTLAPTHMCCTCNSPTNAALYFYFLQFTRNAFESESVAGTHTYGLLVLTACCTCQHKAVAGGQSPPFGPPSTSMDKNPRVIDSAFWPTLSLTLVCCHCCTFYLHCS